MERLHEDAGDEDDEGSPLSLAALQERRKEILARLRVTTNALREAGAVANGYDSAYFLEPPLPDVTPGIIHERFFRRHTEPIDETLWQRLSAQRFAFDPPDRFRSEWRVNDLGREKCQALFEHFDVDDDGRWSYSDYLEYMVAIDERIGERQEMHAIGENEEVWRMYMHDTFAMDEQHRLTFDGFLRYREAVEDTYPLIYDLQAMGISLEWRAVEKMRRVVRTVDEYFSEDDVLPFKSVQFLVGECGLTATYQDLWQTVQRQRLFHRCHRFLLGQKRALRLFGYKQKTAMQLTTPALEEDPRVCRAGVLALVFSAWTPMDRTKWRRVFLEMRLKSYAMLGRINRRVATFFNWTRKAARTGLLRASCLQSTPERELGDYVLKVEVGSNFTTHSTINATYYSDADSAATLHELKYLERGAKCFFYVDFVCRSGTREADAHSLSQKLTWFVELFLKDHLELLPYFFKWFITIPSKMQLRVTGGPGSSSAAGAAPIIRFVVLFSGELDLYEVMQSLELPSSMQFDHLLQRLSMRWMFSHSVEEILTNTRFVAGTQWSCRGQLDTRFNRQAWGQILRQCAMQMNDEIAMEQEEQEFMENQRKQQQQEHKLGRPPKADSSLNDAPRSNQDSNDASRDWIDWLHRLAIFVDSSKELSLTWSFRDLQSMLEDYAWIKTLFSSSVFQRMQSLLSTAGAIANEWKSVGDSFRGEFAGSRFVTSTLAANAVNALPLATPVVTRATPLRSALGSPDDGLRSTRSRQVSANQSDVMAASFPFASPVSTPTIPGSTAAMPVLLSDALVVEEGDANAFPPGQKEDPLEHDLLELYEACAKTLQSVQSMRAEAGTSGLSVAFEGWNVFTILPRVIPTLSGRRSVVIRTKSTMSNSSESSLAATAASLSASVTSPSTAS